MDDPINFDPRLSAGRREVVASVGVDSGTMCIATKFPTDDEWMRTADVRCDGWAGDGWGCTTSGWGDGHYDVLRLVDDDRCHGVEVMFCSPSIDEATERQAIAAGAVEPTEEERQAVYANTADDATRVKHRRWLDMTDAAYNTVRKAQAPTIDPTAETTPTAFGALDVPDGRLGVGDPCYGQHAWIDVQPGRYVLVAWQLPNQGRTARIGAYFKVHWENPLLPQPQRRGLS